MDYIKLKDLMILERILLEFDVAHKFEIKFNDAYKLYEYLKQVGKITNYAFLMQDEFHKKFNDMDKLKEYHEKTMESIIEFNYNQIVNFIEHLQMVINDDKINNLVNENKFW